MDQEEFRLHAELEDTHWWFRARRQIIIDVLSAVVPTQAGRRVVEIGCGTGGNLKELAKCFDAFGIDLSEEAVRHARKRVSVPVHCGDFRQILEGNWGEIDAVLLADVLEHIQDDHAFLSDVIRPLKQDAFVLVTVPAHPFLWSKHDEALGHCRRYSQYRFRELWHDLPVRERFITPFNCFLFPWVALTRFLTRNASSRKSSLSACSPILNALLYRIFHAERTVLHYRSMPFGVSWLALLQRVPDCS